MSMISGMRSTLYKLARLLGDYNALRRGRIVQRVERRAAGRLTARLLSKLFR